MKYIFLEHCGEKDFSEIIHMEEKMKKSKRQIRNYLQLLEARGIVESKETSYGANDFLKMKIYMKIFLQK